MRIERLHIRGFGCLTDRHYEFPADKAVLVTEDNECGKSTLAAAILAGLCGFPARKAAGEAVKLRDVYEPWNGDAYAVEMDLVARGGRIRVERDFARGTFVVRDPDTNRDVSAEFHQDMALDLLGLSRDDFLRIAVITGKEAQRFDSTRSLRDRLSALVEGSDNDSGAEAAIAALTGATYAFEGKSIKPETAITRISNGLNETTQRMRSLDSALDAAGEETRLLDESQALYGSLAERLAELDEEYRLARLREVRERISSAESATEDVQELNRELGDLERYAAFPAERAAQLTRAIARMNERSAQAEEARRECARLSGEADELRVRLGEHSQFELATDEDKVALASGVDAIRNAEAVVERTLAELKHEARSRSVAAGYALIGAGLVVGIVSMALMVMRTLDVAPSVLGTVVGVMVVLAGLKVSRSGGASASARAREQQAEELLSLARERAEMTLARLGVQCEAKDVLDTMSRTGAVLAQHLDRRARLRTVEASLASREREVRDRQASIAEEKATIESILADADIDATLPLGDAVRLFEEAAKRHARFRQIRDELLPAMGKRGVSQEAIAALRAEEAGLGDGPVESTARPSIEVESERRDVRARADAALGCVREMERSVGACVENYRREYPALQEHLSALGAELAKATRFDRALTVAEEALREVSESTHRRWAAALNERASTILPRLNPDYDTLRFDDSLNFTVRHVSDNRIIEKADIDARLSTGAKDQVYLSVRVACCEELSRQGESIPIIFDDPLIAADDGRFARGLEYLVELAREHQVIILSCHKSRHERFAGEGWFAQGIHTIAI